MTEPKLYSAAEPLAAIDPEVFATRSVLLDNGLSGRLTKFESKTPHDFAPLLAGKLGDSVTLDAQLFLPAAKNRNPVVIMVPGSGNIGPHHLEQVSALTNAGIAVLLIDPFRARAISSTIGNQAQLSWAASTYDVIAAFKFLKSVREIDSENIGVLGSSRGGTAALMALTEQVSNSLLDDDEHIKAGFAGYPWCGLQFWNARIAKQSSVLIMSGNKDDWVSVQQCQDFAHSSTQVTGNVNIVLVPGAYHAFDRSGIDPLRMESVLTSSSYPTVYMSDDGTYLDPATGLPDKNLSGEDFINEAVAGGFIRKGVTIGTCGNQAQEYRDTMVRFFVETLGQPKSKSRA